MPDIGTFFKALSEKIIRRSPNIDLWAALSVERISGEN